MGLNLKEAIANLPPLQPAANRAAAPAFPADQPPLDLLGVAVSFGPRKDGPRDLIAVLTATFPANAFLPLQRHPEPVTLIVLSGALEVFAEAPWRTLTVGEALTIPGDTRHAVRNPSADEAVALILAPDDLARFLESAARPLAGGRPVAPTQADYSRFAVLSASQQRWVGDAQANASIGLSQPAPE